MIVVDASVWISVSVPADVFHEPSLRWLLAARARGERFAGPSLVLAEVAGGIRRRTGHLGAGTASIVAVERSPGVDLIPLDETLARRAAVLADDLGLRGADAVYVATAERLGCPFATWDDEIVARAHGAVTVYRPTGSAV